MIAFNPQTVLGEKNKTEINDDIFGPPINAMLRGIKNQDKLYQKSLNLRNFIPFKGKAVIHYSSESLSGVDQRYAKYLQHANLSRNTIQIYNSLTSLAAQKQKFAFEIIANTINSKHLHLMLYHSLNLLESTELSAIVNKLMSSPDWIDG